MMHYIGSGVSGERVTSDQNSHRLNVVARAVAAIVTRHLGSNSAASKLSED